MKETYKNLNIIIISLICLLFIICVFFIKSPPDDEPEYSTENNSAEIYNPRITEQAPTSSAAEAIDYTLKIENEFLNFYLNASSGSILLDSVRINSALYPTEDINALSKGITANTLEEGISIIEDFTS